MNKVLDKLPALVAEELEAANAVNPQFHSMHEGWAVLHEEIQETQEAIIDVEIQERHLWTTVREDSPFLAGINAKKILQAATKTAAEAIQVAAMAQKLIDYIEGGKRNA